MSETRKGGPLAALPNYSKCGTPPSGVGIVFLLRSTVLGIAIVGRGFFLLRAKRRAEDVAEDEAAEEDVAEAAPAPAPVARPTNRTMTRGRTTMSRDGGKTTTRSGTSTRESSGSSSSGSRTMKR